MKPKYQLLIFSQVKHKIPADSLLANYLKEGDYNQEKVIVFPEDTFLETMDLDQPFGEDDPIFLILVEGSLKSRNIYCQETDGATGLVVLGNLECQNMVVGGQEIYVKGNLKVSEVFWGDYNHGELLVQGNIFAQVFIATDYGFQLKRFTEEDQVQVEYWLWDENENEFAKERLECIFQENCLLGEEELEDEERFSWGEWFDTVTIFENLKKGKSLLLDELKDWVPSGEEIPFVFESEFFNEQNMCRLRESILFEELDVPTTEIPTQRVQYWRGDDYKRVVVVKDIPYSEAVYFQKAEKAVLIKWPQQGNASIQNQVAFHIPDILCRIIVDGEEPQWDVFNEQRSLHQEFRELIETFWKKLLLEWSEMEYWQNRFLELVSHEKVLKILALPLVREKYSDYYNEDADFPWWGNVCWQFRQIEKNRCGRITIVEELIAKNEKDRHFEFYHFNLESSSNMSPKVGLCTQRENEYDAIVLEVPRWKVETYKKAIRYFEKLEKRILKMNDTYTTEFLKNKSGNLE